ncbi:MAG TPA: hypothetical protein VN280_15860, partial [Variovorax sp.]|nr:hypothetical protein [Variovorax sp.]
RPAGHRLLTRGDGGGAEAALARHSMAFRPPRIALRTQKAQGRLSYPDALIPENDRKWLHSAPGYRPPTDFELQLAQQAA